MTRLGVSPVFSVIIPTRNRALVFAAALQSVLDQRYRSFEVVVVDDGSSESQAASYHDLIQSTSGPVSMLTLAPVQRGHGPGFTCDYGAAHARGDYLCYLDDDDQWTDPDHLARAASVISTNAGRVDLILANQAAFLNNTAVSQVIWIEDLAARLTGEPDAAGAYSVTPTDLLACQSFCHLNTTIISRALHHAMGGFDHDLRYEQDRDYFLRAIDRADVIKFLPFTVSRHNIPDPAAQANASTTLPVLAKRLCQLRVFDKAALFSTRAELRRHSMRQRAYILDHIAVEAGRMQRPECARYYARQALAAKLSLGWMTAAWRWGFGRRSY